MKRRNGAVNNEIFNTIESLVKGTIRAVDIKAGRRQPQGI